MKFDAYAFLADCEVNPDTGANRANRAKQDAPISTFSTFSTPQGVNTEIPPPAKVLPFAPPPSAEPQPSRDDGGAFRHGRSLTGDPRTWTGRVVSLDAWRSLSAWERHGPDGRLWCGVCRAWVEAFPDCHGGAA